MAFSDQTKYQRFQLAGGQCECVRQVCGHFTRCTVRLMRPTQRLVTLQELSQSLFNQGPSYAFSYPSFQFNHRLSQAANGSDTLLNSEFLCDTCHVNTRSYGTNLTRN
jgi:hypothetical protein